MGHVDLMYRHSGLGTALVAAGHVSESREYACMREKDPFSLPRAQRALALGRSGDDFDDVASFPRAKAACVMPCRRAVRQFLQHRNTIMSRMGDYVFEGKGLTATERRDKVKSLFNSLDMDGTVGAWRTRMGLVDGERTLTGFRVDLGPAGSFDFGQYRRAMAVGTAWLAGRMPAMREFVVMHLRNIRDTRRLEHPERTLASYVFQEAEGMSRAAKIRWSVVRGHTVQNLQHDGVIIRLGFGDGVVGAAQELTCACSRALGYEQPVERK